MAIKLKLIFNECPDSTEIKPKYYFWVAEVSVFVASTFLAFFTALRCFLIDNSLVVVPFAATGFTFAKLAVPTTSNANINTFFMISKFLN